MTFLQNCGKHRNCLLYTSAQNHWKLWAKRFGNLRINNSRPVSYTHLDVYKRQVISFREGIALHILGDTRTGPALPIMMACILLTGFELILESI